MTQMSNLQLSGEDRCFAAWITEAAAKICRGNERSTYASSSRKHVRSAAVHGVVQRRLVGRRPKQKSEEPIVVSKPGNAGGAKGLWFGVRQNEANERGLA